MDRERDGSAYFMAPSCLCASRNQRKIGPLRWVCVCGRENHYRCTADGFLPFTKETAAAMDEQRRVGL